MHPSNELSDFLSYYLLHSVSVCDQISWLFLRNILNLRRNYKFYTMWKVSNYGVFSGLYFPVFELNTGKFGPA